MWADGMRRSSQMALLATLGALLVATPASATSITIGGDGETAPTFDLTQAIRERVFIPQPGIDQDGDGVDDKIAIEISGRWSRAATFKVPAIIDPSPYYTTLCRGNEGECIGDTDSDGLNDRWPLFLRQLLRPARLRGDPRRDPTAPATRPAARCTAARATSPAMKSVIDWLNGRVRRASTRTATRCSPTGTTARRR